MLARAFLAPIILGALYFLVSGDWHYQRAWLYFTCFFLLSVGSNLLLFVKNPELLYHRSVSKKGSKGWDKWLMPVTILIGFHFQTGV